MPDAAKPNKWLVVALLWLVCLINYADRQAIFSVFPLLERDLGIGAVPLGLAAGSFMWAYAVFGPFAGWLGDRFCRKYLICGALVFWSCCTAATAVAHTFWQLAACRALSGLGEAFYFPAAMSLISDYHGAGTRSRAMSLHQTGVYAGTIAGASAAGWLGERYGWHLPFVWFGAMGIALAGLILAVLEEPKREQGAASNLRTVMAGNPLADARVWLSIAAFAAANFVAAVFLSWLPTFLYTKFSMTLAWAGWSSTAYPQTASVLGVLCGGWLADRFQRRIAIQALGLLCGVPFIFLTGWTLSIPVLILAMACFGFFKGMYDANIFAGLYDLVPVENRAVSAGVLNSVGWLGAGFAPVLVAVGAARVGLSATLSATSAVYLAGSLMLGLAALRGSSRRGSERTESSPAATYK